MDTSPYIEAEAKKLGIKRILFPLGRVCITPGADVALEGDAAKNLRVLDLLDRHMRGDWGCVCDEDKALNDEAVTLGNRILSAYPIDETKPSQGFGDNTLWIITEHDRSVTTLLLPEDY